MRRLLLFGGLALAALRALPGTAQALDASFASPTSLWTTGYVDALGPQQADGKRLVAGYFSRVNGNTFSGGLLRLDAAGLVDQAFQQNVGVADEPYRIRGLANGQYLLGIQGNSLTAGGLARAGLLRLNANGTADASFDPGTGPGLTNDVGYSDDFVVQPDGRIIVGGEFDSFNGLPAHGVVRLNANGSVDGTFYAGAGIQTGSSAYNEVYALAVQPDGKILVGGVFSTFNGQPASGLVRLNANGTLDSSFSSPLTGSTYVYALAVQPDGNILVAGALTINGQYGSQLTRLLPSGAFDPGFTLSPAVAGNVYSTYTEAPMMLQPDGKILVIGSFNLPGYPRVARLASDGSLDLQFQAPAGPNNVAATLGLQADGSILLGGGFTAVGNTETVLARLGSSGAVDAGFAPRLQMPGSISTMARQADGAVLAGGSFSEWDGQPVHQLVRLSPAGVLDASYVAASRPLSGTINALLVQADGKTVVGTSQSVYRVLTTGAPDPSFTFFYNPSQPAGITALAQQADGKLLVGGNLAGTVSGVALQRLARVNTDGSLDPSFTRPALAQGLPVSTTALLVQADGRILAGTNFNNNPTAYLLRYEPGGAVDASFTAPTFASNAGTARVASLVQQPDGKLLVGGSFVAVNGTSQYLLARLTTAGSLDASFAPGTQFVPGNVSVLALQPNGRVLVGGSFAANGSAGTYNNLARVLTTGQLDATFSPTGARPNSTVRRLIVQPDGAILLQGSFTAVANQSRLNLARITAPNVLAVQAPAAVAAATDLWPVPARQLLHVQPAATAHPRQAELLDALGRVVQQRILPGAAEFQLDVSGLPAGLYVLRLHYTEGSVSRPLTVE